MDSRDSLSPSAPNLDGSAGDDVGDLPVTVALAKEAALHFQSRKFAECVNVLNQLKVKKEGDPKIFHNIAIAEFFRDGCSDPKKLLEVLKNVQKRCEELAHASGQQEESGRSSGNKFTSDSKGSGTTIQQFSSDSASVIYTDEFDTSVAALNIAVIWFHLHEYSKALSILEPLYQNIEPIDETIALHICLLLLDVVLACHDAWKSAEIIPSIFAELLKMIIYSTVGCFKLLEKAFGISNVSQGEIDLAASVNSSENPLSRTLSDDRLDEMFSTLDIGGYNLTRPAGLTSVNDHPRITVDGSISGVDLKLKLQLHKVRFLLLTRNLKLAKREVKHAMNIARGRDSSMALLLKAQLEYTRGNYRKAIKLLMVSNNRTDAAISSMFKNNLGCIYYKLGKYNSSAVFFSKALGICSSLQKEKPLKLLTFSQDKSLLIAYNCGLQYLACGKPILAARCFQKACLIFYRRPVLWLRLAECCIMAVEKGLVKGSQTPSDRSEIRVNVIGKGRWRKLLIDYGTSRSGHVDSVEKNDWALGSDGQPKLSLPLARQCLYNALHLLNCSEWSNSKSVLPSNSSLEESESSSGTSSKNPIHKKLPSINSLASTILAGSVNSNGDLKETKGGANNEILQNSVSYYEDIRRRENQMIKQALLANLAYVELELDNPLKALSAALSLLELPERLAIYLSGGNNVESPFSQEDCELWQVEKPVDCEEPSGGAPAAAKNPSHEGLRVYKFLKPEEARGTIYANLAAVSAIQGELELAHHFVTQALSLVPNSSEATMTAIYVDLMLGKSEEALSKLKHCSHVRFLPSSLQLNKSS
ncbi:36.4 kDa proline-rich protein-like [Hibiscus syriacus]|uniref:36.4 kDa proline-rich protein-like n=1 Tax=Hibiscus syriacus TaxID=106335 RepID=A0A6A2ZAK5_HIBSY|nr:36.4 kDa proline-rich protein-like [Hibiscus syriacus]